MLSTLISSPSPRWIVCTICLRDISDYVRYANMQGACHTSHGVFCELVTVGSLLICSSVDDTSSILFVVSMMHI